MADVEPVDVQGVEQGDSGGAASGGNRRSRGPLWFGLAALAVVLAGGLVLAIGGDEAAPDDGKPLPKVARIPTFSLTERSGETVADEDLRGRIWIADFFFTSCTGPCPILSLRMRGLQESVRKYDGEVRLISFSVDPTYDRPPVLRQYAKRYNADDDLWWFVTSDDEKAMHTLVRDGFLQAVTPAIGGGPIIHSTRLILIDREGYIRAWYDGEDNDCKPLILRDIKKLLREGPRHANAGA